MAGSFLEIDGESLLRNVAAFRSLLHPGTRLMAVVKADAYGHGLRLVAPLLRGRVDAFGVDSLEEAEELGTMEVEEPILIMGHSDPAGAERVVAGGFRQVLFRRDLGEALSRAARRLGKPARVHLKVETGLNRLGVPPEEVAGWGAWVAEREGLVLEALYTHFADVEDPESALVQAQLQKLREAAAVLPGHPGIHAAPTAGALLHSQKALAWTRVGIGLYGIWPSEATRRAVERSRPGMSLLPVLAWKSRLVQVKTVRAGATVGYDLTYRASSERRIGVVPVGYYDGYDRGLSGRGRVLVRGRKVPVVGRVAMNMFMVDVTEADAREGDEVVLLGEQGPESVTAEEIASSIGTIAYEVLARLNPRLERRLGDR